MLNIFIKQLQHTHKNDSKIVEIFTFDNKNENFHLNNNFLTFDKYRNTFYQTFERHA